MLSGLKAVNESVMLADDMLTSFYLFSLIYSIMLLYMMLILPKSDVTDPCFVAHFVLFLFYLF